MLLALTRLLVVLAPFGVVRRLLGPDRPLDPSSAEGAALGPADVARARWISHVVQVAASRTPWTSSCYPQALTARILLRAVRLPHRVCFGVRRDATGELRAHAWVTAGEVAVTGGSLETWSGVATYGWRP
ncbi:MAG: lasso peptide biosynthesis B2 protein [Nocardioidaceae bacterium]|nr:lasso peptide biosynthesis B2 protein [Nocardioidaceae bacterium]MCL2613884.1 lasso peptide biosynthesis B2 protein [Nocardioidaceae bacterium]